jgi:hypothetical protein
VNQGRHIIGKINPLNALYIGDSTACASLGIERMRLA